jgi:hypothetical protein
VMGPRCLFRAYQAKRLITMMIDIVPNLCFPVPPE